MRPLLKQVSFVVVAAFVSLTLTLVFQNCGAYQSGVNPLTDGVEASVCEGASCTPDLQFVEINVANGLPMALKKPAEDQAPSSSCDASTCLDVAGFCNTAGFANSLFYYQWRLENLPVGSRVATSARCDAMGKFHLLVRIPPESVHAFDYAKTYSVDVIMAVIDSQGVQQENPASGVSTKSPTVTGI